MGRRSGFRRRLFLLALVLASPSASCRREFQEPFQLEAFLQADAVDLPLNASLVWLFSESVDPTSVYSGGLRIDESIPSSSVTRSVPGGFEIQPGGRLVFLPRIASKPDLSDGGFRPGRTYRVTLEGFPKASGLRSAHGEVLTRSHVFSFRTTARPDSYFEDRSPSRGPILRPNGELHRIITGFGPEPAVVLDPLGKLSLLADEPLRPDTVTHETLTLVQVSNAGVETRVPLEVRLENASPEAWGSGGARAGFDLESFGARIEIDVKATLEPDSLAILRISDRVTDFGGNALQGPFSRTIFLATEATRPRADASIVEEFVGAREQVGSEGLVPNHATAVWSGDGRIRASFPWLAARSNPAWVLPETDEVPIRIEARRFEIPTGRTITARAGTVASGQSRVAIEGHLRVVGELDRTEIDAAAPYGVVGLPFLVLVAGGDLVVSGTIEAKGPVLLAAGGAVRLPKGSRIAASRLLVISPAPCELAGELPVERQVQRTPLPEAGALQLDESLTYEGSSPWYRTAVPLVKFRAAQWIGDAGTGRIRLLFRSARSLVSNPSEVDTATVTPWIERAEDLPPADRVQFKVELEIPATAVEKPLRLPFVDRLTIPAHRS